ncbi:zonular occludens toxin domain-containing protein [Acinetobacter baylyi]|uniref:zonular occludens toxin domain-containing protein n=1 Tax=Acinetobacter baylyi TaxID=202950 RepID=UPI000EA328E7|nr:zonular occludens toxin domain-containing protein [Acinetobacter baylyi]
MINLVVGSPGHGKTQFMISKILEIIKDNEKLEAEGKPSRQIYCDIKELLIPEVEPAPDDWRDTPDGSIIIYDEVQYRKEYEYKGNQYSQDQMIKDLTIHRHTNKDLWLITQDPQRIEKGIHKLIDRMYYIKRPASKPKYTNVFEFDKWLSNPEPAANRNAKHKKYLDFYRFHFDDKYQSLYKSATDHSSIKFKLPKQLFVFLGIIAAILIFVGVGLMNTNTFNVHRFEDKEKDVKKETSTTNTTNIQTSDPNAKPDLNVECRKGINVEKPECVKWFDELSKNNGSITGQNSQTTMVSYNPNKPFDTQEIQDSIQYQVTAKPVLSGCMKTNKGYQAYTQQGTKLDVSQDDCKKIMSGDRPFNYFAQEQQNGLSTQNNLSANSTQVSQQNTQQTNAKMTEPYQANNQVQRGLEHDFLVAEPYRHSY